MHTEFDQSIASNPFAAMLDPESLAQAHARMSTRVPCTIYRPLDKPLIPKTGQTAGAQLEAEIEADQNDPFSDFDFGTGMTAFGSLN
ncbi:hypothetical protein [Rhodoferax sp.]|uniref:hypothetical protein n=1 Tax=Rhodoferax sp. TaxID=50421 RepID=UPI00374DF65D